MWFFRKTKREVKPVKEKAPNAYPNFLYAAEQIKCFLPGKPLFSVMLKNYTIIYHKPDDARAFYSWLIANDIENILPDRNIDSL